MKINELFFKALVGTVFLNFLCFSQITFADIIVESDLTWEMKLEDIANQGDPQDVIEKEREQASFWDIILFRTTNLNKNEDSFESQN